MCVGWRGKGDIFSYSAIYVLVFVGLVEVCVSIDMEFEVQI